MAIDFKPTQTKSSDTFDFQPTQKAPTKQSEPSLLSKAGSVIKDIVVGAPKVAKNIADVAFTKEGREEFSISLVEGGIPSIKNVVHNYNDLFWGGAQKTFEKIGGETLAGWAEGDKNVSRQKAKEANNEVREFMKSYALTYDNVGDERGFLERITAKDGEEEVAKILGTQLPTFLGLLGVGVTTGGSVPAILGTSFALNAGDAYQQGKDYLEENNIPLDREWEGKLGTISALVGATTAPLDAMGLDRILTPSKFVNFKSAFLKNTMNTVLDTGFDIVAEGGTEGLQEIIQNAWGKTYNENQNLFEGVPEAIFGGGIFSGGSSFAVNVMSIATGGKTQTKVTNPALDEVTQRIKTSEAFDIEAMIKSDPAMESKIYSNPETKVLTPEFAEGRINDVAQKAENFQAGLGEQVRAKIDINNTTYDNIVKTGLEVVQGTAQGKTTTPPVFGAGASMVFNSSGLLSSGIIERLKMGFTSEEVVNQVVEGAKEAGVEFTEAQAKEAVENARKGVEAIVNDIKTKLQQGETPARVALELTQKGAPAEQAQIVVNQVAQDTTTKTAVEETTKTLSDITEKIDETVLDKTPADMQAEFDALQSRIDTETTAIKDKIAELKDTLEKAKPQSIQKKQAKILLAKENANLRKAEANYKNKVVKQAENFRTFVSDYVTKNFDVKLSATKMDDLVDNIVISATSPKGVSFSQPIASLIKNEVAKFTTQKPAEDKVAKEETVSDYVKKYVDNNKSVSLGGLEEFIKANPTQISKEDIVSEYKKYINELAVKKLKGEMPTKKKTQKEIVKEAVEKKGKASIKEIAKETKILEPNVRRILGVGAKEGVFDRVADGVYTITVGDKEMAYIIPADAVEVLPKLAKEGFKADMIFLDIPYKTPAVVGGNRGVKYNLITTEQFSGILDSVKQILKTEDSPVIHMYSQAQSGLKAMQKYNDLFVEKGLSPIARGEYTKFQQDGVTRVRNMRGNVIEPEGILVFNKSGKFNENIKDLNFKLIRPKGYQTEKPAEMLKALIEMTTKEGDVILDPFAGSGVTGAEAIKAGRKSVSIEKSKEVAEKVTKPRIEEASKEAPKKEETKLEKVTKVGEKVVRSVPVKRIYGKGLKTVKGEYSGKPYTTNSYIIEFSDVEGVESSVDKKDAPTSESIQIIIDKVKEGTDIGNITHFVTSVGTTSAVFRDGIALNVDYYNYFLRKYPNMVLKGTTNTKPVGVYVEEKLVGMIMPFYLRGRYDRIEISGSDEVDKIKFKTKDDLENNESFKNWFGDSKIINGEGKPLVVYHGTTNKFTSFNKSKANVEGDFGAGFYFSTSLEDVEINYKSETGADLTGRIERLAEKIDSEKEIGIEKAREEARVTLSEGVETILPVYLSVQNPVIVGGKNETQLFEVEIDPSDIDAKEGTDEYYELYMELADQEAQSVVDDIYSAVYNAGVDFDILNQEEIIAKINEIAFENGYEGIGAREFLEKLKSSEELLDIYSENGELAGHEFVRSFLEELGYDGIIDNTVNQKWGGESDRFNKMEGMDSDTQHIIVFNPRQIKSVDNKGGFSTSSDDIFLKREGQKVSEYTKKEAMDYLEDFKSRLKVDFDVFFVDNILADKKINPFTKEITGRVEAYGATADNTIALVNEMASHTAEHETVHLTLANMDKMPVFKEAGLTREKVLKAKAQEMNIEFTKQSASRIEEQLALDFEKYIAGTKPQNNIIDKFYAILKKLITDFARAVGLTKMDVVLNYYDIMAEGKEISEGITRFENKGIVQSFIDEGILDTEYIEDAMTALRLIQKPMDSQRASELLDELHNAKDRTERADILDSLSDEDIVAFAISEQGGEAFNLMEAEMSYLLDVARRKGERDGSMKFKIKEDGDKRLNNLEKEYNQLQDKVEILENDTDAWRTDLEHELIKRVETAKLVEETPEQVKKISRFTKRTPPKGELTARGAEVVETLEFENVEQAQEELNAYLTRKQEILTTRNRMSELRKDIANARKQKKLTQQALRDVQRKLKLRKEMLERKDYYVDMGFKRGKREQMKMIRRRRRAVRNIQEMLTLSDKKADEIIKNRKYQLMTEAEFNDFFIEFVNKAHELRDTMDAQTTAQAIIQEKQYSKVENLIKAMGLPPIAKMTEEQATRLVEVLSTYEFGDTFLTKKQLETIHRTQWGEMKTERELLAKLKEHTGTGVEELKTLTAPAEGGIYTPWIKLARKHPFFNWLVGKRFEANVKSEREFLSVEEDLNDLVSKARSSRRKKLTLKEKVREFIVPTDEIVFNYIESENKAQYLEKNPMTNEELKLAEYLIKMYFNAYEYLQSEYGTEGRENYMTHVRRSFFEAMKESGFKSALREVITSQKEDEATFKILDEETGNVLAFEKWFGFAQRRTGGLVPSKNIAKASLAYFRAFAKKKAMDEFVPEVLIALQAHKAVTGTTEQGLSKDPTLEKFVKRYLNDAKGRRIWFGTKQGSQSDIALRASMTWVAIKYLGFNLATAVANFIGDFTVVFWELSNKEALVGLGRSFNLPKVHEVNKQFRFFTGRNPIVELFDPQYNLPSRVMKSIMVLMSLASFQTNKFFLRSKMTQEEWETGVVNDKRLTEFAQSLSRIKPNHFYVKSLAGSTSLGTSAFTFGSWAVSVFNTVTSDITEVGKMLKNKKTWDALTSEEAQKVAKFVIMGTIAYALVSMIEPPEDDDKSMYAQIIRKAQRELTTLFQAIQFVTDPSSYGLAIREMAKWYDLLAQIFTQEEYKSDGVGYGIGDKKYKRTFEKLITPTLIRQLFPDEKGDTKQRLLDEAVESGTLDAEKIVEELYGNTIKDKQDDGESVEDIQEYRDKKIAEITKLYNFNKNYSDSVLGNIIINKEDNDDAIEKMVQYAKQVGYDTAYSELKDLYKDRNLCSNPEKKTGCLVSGQLLKEFQKQKKLFNN